MNKNEFETFDEALLFSIKQITSNGELTSPRNIDTMEILNYSFLLKNPRARLVNIKARKWSFPYALGELCWHLNASNKLDDILYYSRVWSGFSQDKKTILASCYGNKIFGHQKNKNSAWQNIIELIKKDQDTRRAVFILNRDDDLFGNDVSCIISIQFIVRNNKLNCITNMRSNDIIWGLCYDVFFITFLQELLAKELGLELGWYSHNAASLHLYKRHMEMAKNIIHEGLPKNIKTMKPIKDTSFLSSFLRIEKALREGYYLSDAELISIPEFWKDLVIPLNQKSIQTYYKKT